MSNGWQWWIEDPDGDTYHGPHLTKDEAISYAVLEGLFIEDYDDEEKIRITITEAISHTMEDVNIDADDLLEALSYKYEEEFELPDDLSKDDKEDLEIVINKAFQMWANDHSIKLKFTYFKESHPSESIIMKKPDDTKI